MQNAVATSPIADESPAIPVTIHGVSQAPRRRPGRPPKGERAMTNAERQRSHQARKRESGGSDNQGSVHYLRSEPEGLGAVRPVPPAPNPRTEYQRTYRQRKKTQTEEQLREAEARKSAKATHSLALRILAAVGSGVLPVLSFWCSHYAVKQQPYLWFAVVLALAFSIPNVFKWCSTGWGTTQP